MTTGVPCGTTELQATCTTPSVGRPAGRPSKFTDERAERIIEAIAAGNFQSTAARLAGVSPAALAAWLARGRRATSGRFFVFLNRVKEAEAKAEASEVMKVRVAGADDWRASAWYLERKHPERWGRQTAQKVRVSGDVTHTVIDWTRFVQTLPRAVQDQLFALEGGSPAYWERLYEAVPSGLRRAFVERYGDVAPSLVERLASDPEVPGLGVRMVPPGRAEG